MADILWTPEPDGEYNEHHAVINSLEVVLYSDRSEETWHYYVNGEESVTLDAKDLEAAKREVAHEVSFG